MYKMLKFGVGIGVLTLLTACGTSEHFMQDDVYNTRTPIMPPGTDLNDVTDYATFVAKKEQEAEPERTAYVSPRQYQDYFYYSQFQYYGYSPYSTLSGLGYYGYGNYHYPMGYGYGNNFYPSMGYSYWNYNNIGFGSYYGSGYSPYGYYYNDPWNPYYNQHPYYSGNTSWYTPASSKPKTVSNLSGAHAGVRRSTSPPVGYPHQIAANPGSVNGRATGISRSSNSRISTPSSVVNTGGRSTAVNRGESVRPASSGRAAAGAGGSQRAGNYQQRPAVNQSDGVRSTRPTMNNSNNNNNTPTRVSTPTMRSGGSSGGSVTPSSGGGSRSGGRR